MEHACPFFNETFTHFSKSNRKRLNNDVESANAFLNTVKVFYVRLKACDKRMNVIYEK